jgi:hypothetical protein
MTSTYSTNLKINLMGTGDQSGTWGSTTNTNLGTIIEEAIVGYVTQAVADSASPTVLTIPNGASSNGRNYVLELTGVLTANRTVEVPAVDKPYIFYNNTTGGYAVTVKVSGQTGVLIKNGKKAIVYTNSTDVIEVANAPVTEDGAQTLTGKTMSGASNTFSSIPFSALAGTVTVAAGGTGQTTYTDGQLLIGNSTGNTLTKATLTAGSGISVTNGSGSITLAASNVPGTSVSGQYAPRVSSAASPSSISLDIGSYDQYVVTALANSLSFPASTTGSPVNGNKIIIRIKDDGTARALSWTTSGAGSFRAIGVTLPTTTVVSKVLYVGCIYNSTESYWDVVAVNVQG